MRIRGARRALAPLEVQLLDRDVPRSPRLRSRVALLGVPAIRRVTSASIAPALLVAMPQLLDPNFHRAVVRRGHHDEEGDRGSRLREQRQREDKERDRRPFRMREQRHQHQYHRRGRLQSSSRDRWSHRW